MMCRVIAISGTPGTGKTTVAKILAKRLNAQILELSEVVRKQGLVSAEDFERQTLIADLEKLEQYLVKVLEQSSQQFIVVGHYADIVPDHVLDILLILRSHPKQLAQRLQQRSWSQAKILENLQAEILGECTAQSLRQHPQNKIFEIDTTQRSLEEVADIIKEILAGEKKSYSVGKISWLTSLEPQLLHRIMEKNQLP